MGILLKNSHLEVAPLIFLCSSVGSLLRMVWYSDVRYFPLDKAPPPLPILLETYYY